MIGNPDQEPERWDEPIVAENPLEARRECQRRAERYGVELESIDSPTKPSDRSLGKPTWMSSGQISAGMRYFTVVSVVRIDC